MVSCIEHEKAEIVLRLYRSSPFPYRFTEKQSKLVPQKCVSEQQNAIKLILPMQILHQLKKMLNINKHPSVLSVVYKKPKEDSFFPRLSDPSHALHIDNQKFILKQMF